MKMSKLIPVNQKQKPRPALQLTNENGIRGVRQRLKNRELQIKQMLKYIDTQIQNLQDEQYEENKRLREVELSSKQKKVNTFPEQIKRGTKENESGQLSYFKQRETFTRQKQFQINILSTAVFYPPACAAYDIAYCKGNDTIYVYGGVSCAGELKDGIKQYFYKFQEGKWKQITIRQNFLPAPRYGHTLSGANDYLLMFGGVSEYKQKLKDRCFYSDVWAFNVNTNIWKIMQFSGETIRNRKNHAACFYNKFYIVSGGIDYLDEVINEISWVGVEEKKGKWKTKKIQGRFNHQIATCQSHQGMDYLFVFGGRNSQSELISQLIIYPIYVSDGQLHFKQPIKVGYDLLPCEFPIMKPLQNGILIIGGINRNNEAINQCWYYNIDKLSLQAVKSKIDWRDLRGGKGVSLNGRAVYVLSGSNSKKYKAIKIFLQQTHDDQLNCFKF